MGALHIAGAFTQVNLYVKISFMKDVLYLKQLEQAETLLKPARIAIVRALAEPHTCGEVAAVLEQTPQRVYYHVKRLVETGLVHQVSERKVRAIHEGIYQATARSFWLSPHLVGQIGTRRSSDAMSLGHLLDLSEEIQQDVAGIDLGQTDLPSIGISGRIQVKPEQRTEFLRELQETLQGIFTRYGGNEGDAFKLAVACYPFTKEEV